MYRAQLGVLVLVLPLATAPAAPVPPDDGQRNLYFPTRKGVKWVYQSAKGTTSTEVVTDVKENSGVFTVWVGQEVDGKIEPLHTLAVSQKGVFLVAERGQTTYDPPLCELKLPLPRGEMWEMRTKLVMKNDSSNLTASYTAQAETVKVPAGKFEAVRVMAKSQLDEDEGHFRATFWYARGVGVVKFESGNVRRELKTFTSVK